jgi:hypothetical protein
MRRRITHVVSALLVAGAVLVLTAAVAISAGDSNSSQQDVLALRYNRRGC